MARDFKGVWIPADLWLDSSIKPIHKFFILEIDSFSKKGKCFASNAHFADLFHLSKRQVSRIINDMATLKLINVKLKYHDKQVIERVLTPVDRIVHTPHDNLVHTPIDKSGACTIPKSLLTPKDKDTHTPPKSDFTLPQHIDKEIWDEWMQIRKRLRAINSPRAKKMLLSELDKCEAAGITANNAIDIAISKSWKSINPSWITNLDKSHDDKRSRSERGHDNLMELCGSAYSDSDDGGQDIFDVLPDVAGSLEGKTGRGRSHSEVAEETLDSEDARFHNANRIEGNQLTNH